MQCPPRHRARVERRREPPISITVSSQLHGQESGGTALVRGGHAGWARDAFALGAAAASPVRAEFCGLSSRVSRRVSSRPGHGWADHAGSHGIALWSRCRDAVPRRDAAGPQRPQDPTPGLELVQAVSIGVGGITARKLRSATW